jgi:hypothetical protein
MVSIILKVYTRKKFGIQSLVTGNDEEQQKQITFANYYGANRLQIRFCEHRWEAERG